MRQILTSASFITRRQYARVARLVLVACLYSTVGLPTQGAMGQDLDALLTQVALRDRGGIADLEQLRVSKFPKLLSYAIYKRDVFMSHMAKVALTDQHYKPDLEFLRLSLKKREELPFVVSALEVLDANAAAAEDEILDYLAHEKDQTYKQRLTTIIGSFGLESVYRLALINKADLSPLVWSSMSHIRDENSVKLLAASLEGKAQIPPAWAEQALKAIIATLGTRERRPTDLAMMPRERSVRFDLLPLPLLSSQSTFFEAAEAHLKPLLLNCISAHCNFFPTAALAVIAFKSWKFPKSAIRQFLEDDHADVRRAAALALVDDKQSAGLVQSILEDAASSENLGLKLPAIDALASHFRRSPKLEQALLHPERSVRWSAAVAFVEQDTVPKDAIPIFVEMLRDDDKRYGAARGLSSSGEASLPLLAAAISEGGGRRVDALFALEWMSDRTNLESIASQVIMLLSDSDRAVSASAAHIISNHANAQYSKFAAELLAAFDSSESDQVRTYLITAFSKIGRAAPLTFARLVEATLSPADNIATDAAKALAEVSPLEKDDLRLIESIFLRHMQTDSSWELFEPKYRLWERLKDLQSRMKEDFIEHLKSADRDRAQQIARLFMRLDKHAASNALIDILRTLDVERASLLIGAALETERSYDASPLQATAVSIIADMVKSRSGTGRQAAIQALTLVDQLRRETYPLCGRDRSTWRNIEPAKTLESRDDLISILWETLRGNPNSSVGRSAAILLSELGYISSEITTEFRSAVTDDDPYVRTVSAAILVKFAPTISALSLMIEHDANKGFECTAQIIKSIDSPDIRKLVLSHLRALQVKDREVASRYYIAKAMLRIDGASPFAISILQTIVEALHAESWDKQLILRLALPELVNAGGVGPESIAKLIGLLTGHSGADHELAIKGLRQIGEPAFAALVDVATRNSGSGAYAAAAAIGEAFGATYIPELTIMLQSAKARKLAVIALAKIGPPASSTVPLLETLAMDRDPLLADSAAWALYKIVSKRTAIIPFLCRIAARKTEVEERRLSEFSATEALSDFGLSTLPSLRFGYETNIISKSEAIRCVGGFRSQLKILNKKAYANLEAAAVGTLSPGDRELWDLSYKWLIGSYSDFEKELGTAIDDSDRRSAATKVLLSLAERQGSEINVPQTLARRLIDAFNSEVDASIRAKLIDSFSRMKEPSLNEVIRIAIRADASPDVRALAVSRAVEMPIDSVVIGELLAAVRNDHSATVRRSAADALAYVGRSAGKHRSELFDALLSETNPNVQEGILDAIGAEELTIDETVDFLKTAMDTAPTSGLRRSSARLLGRDARQGLDLLFSVLAQPNADEGAVAAAVQGLIVSPHPGAITRLVEALNLHVPMTRIPILRGLREVGPRGFVAIGVLSRIALNGAVEERVAALDALASIGWGTSVVVAAVNAALSNPDVIVREAAVRAAGELGGNLHALTEMLLLRLQDEYAAVRQVAAYAIREINPKDERVISQLMTALYDNDVVVRQNAVSALGSYGGEARRALNRLEALRKDPDLVAWIDCAVNRITNNNLPNRYGSMLFRSAQPRLPDWPPAKPSTHDMLDEEYLVGAATLRDAYVRLARSLKTRNYDLEVMKAPGGFAIASRVERYDPTTGLSLPEPNRWTTIPAHLSFDSSILTHFFAGEEVHIRVFLFILTDVSFKSEVQGDLDSRTFLNWVYARANMLPAVIQSSDVMDKHCLVYVYNFSGKQRSLTLRSDVLDAHTQLERAGILEGLEVYAAR
jgi:HEAT repeat protein